MSQFFILLLTVVSCADLIIVVTVTGSHCDTDTRLFFDIVRTVNL